MKAKDLQEILAEDLAYGETDGAVSIRPDMVAQRLNELLLIVQRLENQSGRCRCLHCVVLG